MNTVSIPISIKIRNFFNSQPEGQKYIGDFGSQFFDDDASRVRSASHRAFMSFVPSARERTEELEEERSCMEAACR